MCEVLLDGRGKSSFSYSVNPIHGWIELVRGRGKKSRMCFMIEDQKQGLPESIQLFKYYTESHSHTYEVNLATNHAKSTLGYVWH